MDEFPIYDYDESLIESCRTTSQNQLSIYNFPETAIVLGRGSKFNLEVNREEYFNDPIKVYQRRGGGCAVVLDPGNIIVSVALVAPGLKQTKEYFQRCTDWMILGMKKCGVGKVYQDGISDLVMDNRKIAGSCVWRSKDIFYYSVSLLVDADLSLIDRYLLHPPREPEYRQGRSHSEFVTNIFDESNPSNRQTLMECLKHQLSLPSLH
ncbi:hypothetical protein K8I28_16255 [bacterium]|nr:hypothetical protein [bacterium]